MSEQMKNNADRKGFSTALLFEEPKSLLFYINAAGRELKQSVSSAYCRSIRKDGNVLSVRQGIRMILRDLIHVLSKKYRWYIRYGFSQLPAVNTFYREPQALKKITVLDEGQYLMSLGKIKISENAKRDFFFFANTTLDMIGVKVGDVTNPDLLGLSALECFYAKDTHGKTLASRELPLLEKVFRSKASWNLQVKMWAEGLVEGTLFREELDDYCTDLPEWVKVATLRQARKIFLKVNGFEPKFSSERY